jgi:hypothetical protein
MNYNYPMPIHSSINHSSAPKPQLLNSGQQDILWKATFFLHLLFMQEWPTEYNITVDGYFNYINVPLIWKVREIIFF